LEQEATQVLWDYSAETTNSLKEMVTVLKERFGEANQADKYRMEVKNRRRQPGETLRSLHSDIRRLVALVLPEFDRKARETMACDNFIDALNDPDLALKVRERSPKDLDSALRIALQLEVWSTNVDRSQWDRAVKDRKARELARTENKQDQTTELPKKRMIELEKQFTDLQKSNQAEAPSNPKTEKQPSESDQTRPKTIAETARQPKETYPPREREDLLGMQ